MLFIVLIAVHIYKTEEIKERKTFIKTIWNRKKIYGQIVIHLYDTATDIGVLIEWGILSYDTVDYKSLDMRILFYTSLGFSVAYRCISALIGFLAEERDPKRNKNYFLDCCLGFLDMYIMKVVYDSLKGSETEPTSRQKMIQLLESIFESLPQVVLQSVFIIRSYNDTKLKQMNSIYLVGLSLLASLFSIANKYTWLDKGSVVQNARNFRGSLKGFRGPDYNNYWFLLRIVWRFSFVMTRFCVLSLIWSVCGGAFLGIFLPISYLYWVIAFQIYLKYNVRRHKGASKKELIVGSFLYGFAALIATPACDSKLWAWMHGTEMIFIMGIITAFGYNDSFDCVICADPMRRQAVSNPYIQLFIIAGWISMVIDFVAYFLMLYFYRITENALIDAFYGFLYGLGADVI